MTKVSKYAWHYVNQKSQKKRNSRGSRRRRLNFQAWFFGLLRIRQQQIEFMRASLS